jgi:Asp-tRNA(Asn)/Glu-tRNA(Gln) amidotransferase A subunit family amidase
VNDLLYAGVAGQAAAVASYTGLWNLTGNPAANVPAGISRGGLPLGAQLVGRLYDEATLVSLSAQLEAAEVFNLVARSRSQDEIGEVELEPGQAQRRARQGWCR